MTSMIEMVAKAIKKEFGRDLANLKWEDLARAAIQAMRDPTPEMIAAMAKDIGPLRLMWIAAIEAALNETE